MTQFTTSPSEAVPLGVAHWVAVAMAYAPALNETIHVYVTVPLPPRAAGNVSVAAGGVCPWSIVAVDTEGALALASAAFTVTEAEAEVEVAPVLSVTLSSKLYDPVRVAPDVTKLQVSVVGARQSVTEEYDPAPGAFSSHW
jgi:hypothetical protein